MTLKLQTMKMMPMVEGVMIQKAGERLDENRRFKSGEHHQHAARGMLDELAKWGKALKTMRR